LAKKRAKTEIKPIPTKRQLSRHKRQQRVQRIMYICGAVFLVAIFTFLCYAVWHEQYLPFHQPAAKINGTTYDMDYYIKTLNFYSKLSSQGQDATQLSSLAEELINNIHYNQILIAAAPQMGVSVSNEEVNSLLQYYQLKDNKPDKDAAEGLIIAKKLLQDYFDKEIPATVKQVDTQAMFVESTDVADKVKERLAAGDNFTALATEYSLEQTTKNNGGNLGWLPKGYTDILLGNLGNSELKDIPFELQAGEVSEPTFDGTVSKSLGYWVVQVTEKDDLKGSHVRGILVGSRHDADAIREKILAGEDFAGLVKDYSQDTTSVANGGDLGWTGEGGMTNRLVMGIAMPLEIGDVSQPAADSSVQTVGGFWLVKAVDRDDNREVDDKTRQAISMGLFDKWLSEQMKNDSVEKLLTDEQKTWAVNQVVKGKS
jgi:parvulin-like peptidyl-prolyl isomerase